MITMGFPLAGMSNSGAFYRFCNGRLSWCGEFRSSRRHPEGVASSGTNLGGGNGDDGVLNG